MIRTHSHARQIFIGKNNEVALHWEPRNLVLFAATLLTKSATFVKCIKTVGLGSLS